MLIRALVNAQSACKLPQDGLCLDPKLCSRALDTQRQIIDSAFWKKITSRLRALRPVPASHFSHIPAEA